MNIAAVFKHHHIGVSGNGRKNIYSMILPCAPDGQVRHTRDDQFRSIKRIFPTVVFAVCITISSSFAEINQLCIHDDFRVGGNRCQELISSGHCHRVLSFCNNRGNSDFESNSFSCFSYFRCYHRFRGFGNYSNCFRNGCRRRFFFLGCRIGSTANKHGTSQ